MARHNLLFAVEPFMTSTIVGTSSQQTRFPASNVLRVRRRSARWRTTATTQQTIDFSSPSTPQAMYLGHVNYTEVLVYSSQDGLTWTLAGPNLLRQSFNSAIAPWAWPGSVIQLPTTAPGLDPNGPNAVFVQIATSGTGIEQAIGTSSDGPAIAGVWLRAFGASATVNVSLTLGTITTTTPAPLTPEWQFFTVSGTGNEGLNSTFFRILAAANNQTFLFGGAFVKRGFDLPLTVYDTGALGMKIPANPYTGIRQLLITRQDGGPYTRVTIPSQTPTDGSLSFATGQILLVSPFAELPDYPQLPVTVTPKTAVARQDYDDESREYRTLGLPYVTLQLQGTFATARTSAMLHQLGRAPLGSLVLLHDNLWLPGVTQKALVDPSQAYLTQLTERSAYTYDVAPELVTFSWTLDEVV